MLNDGTQNNLDLFFTTRMNALRYYWLNPWSVTREGVNVRIRESGFVADYRAALGENGFFVFQKEFCTLHI
jgi:hypothetical protein